MADVRFFLKIDGVGGESKDAIHKGEIELLNYSLEEISGGTPGIKYTAINVSMNIDKTYRTLQAALASDQRFKSALLTVRKEGQNPVEFLKITMGDVMVTGLQLAADRNPSDPIAVATLTFNKYEARYNSKREGQIGRAGFKI
jgi:type VI secretion system secreted protein Hcp